MPALSDPTVLFRRPVQGRWRAYALSASIGLVLAVPELRDSLTNRVADLRQTVASIDFDDGRISLPVCRSMTCTYTTAAVPVEPAFTLRASWSAPGIVRLPWPAGLDPDLDFRAMVSSDMVARSYEQHPSTGGRAMREWRLAFETNTQGNRAHPVDTPGYGFVAGLASPGADGRLIDIDFVMSSTESLTRHGKNLELAFQPVPDRLDFAIAPDDLGRIGIGDMVSIRIERMKRQPGGRVVRLDPIASTLTVELENPYWIDEYFRDAGLQSPNLHSVSLRIEPQATSSQAAIGTTTRVPLQALAAGTANGPVASGEAIVWTLMDPVAVPVHVRVASKHGAVAVVNEIGYRFSDSIRPADWAKMSLAARHIVYKAARSAYGGLPRTLLGAGAILIVDADPLRAAGAAARRTE